MTLFWQAMAFILGGVLAGIVTWAALTKPRCPRCGCKYHNPADAPEGFEHIAGPWWKCRRCDYVFDTGDRR